jgi:hypothetical protein
MDQNNIILILLLIAVLVSFYAIYLAMENSKKIKKVGMEMVDLAKLIHESSNMDKQYVAHEPVELKINNNLDEYPTLEEVNSVAYNSQEIPLDESLKNKINNLENLNEEELLQLEKQLDAEENLEEENLEDDNVEGLDDTVVKDEDEDENVDDNVVKDENVDDTVVKDDNVEDNVVKDENVDDNVDKDDNVVKDDNIDKDDVVKDTVEGLDGNVKYPSLSELTEDSLNELSCDDLREICKRDELRTRGRKSELVERILKKKNALI